MDDMHPSEQAMGEAIKIAEGAESSGNYPVGSIVIGGRMTVIGAGFTELHSQPDPTAHAEILALRRACKAVNSRYLPGYFLYTTLEPCPMCTSAAIWAKVEGIVYGASLEDAFDFAGRSGSDHSWRRINIKSSYVVARGAPVLTLHERFMRDECLKLV
ncbi:nucleoside deaminase [Spongiactinospora sp. TRM90649]|uniref:nucleoside deaminase n=1 Tax=Spongiactinospora sp. TRM90649 TaxID=3031114 RepID=UPI0023F70D67|nr:nucleoside deaminase [Spongiactinospora sp. TRM90649]MDF5755673.1 nucleoside deaminase [Spongiactinospora sp. TRM90649]